MYVEEYIVYKIDEQIICPIYFPYKNIVFIIMKINCFTEPELSRKSCFINLFIYCQSDKIFV